MSEQDFELYLTLLAKTLRLSDKQRDAIASELRDHLEARLDELTAEGMDKHEAIQAALAEFGDASALAYDFTSIQPPRTRSRIMQTTFGTLATAAAVALAATFLTPSNYQGNPPQPPAGAQADPPGDDAPTLPPAIIGHGRLVDGRAVQLMPTQIVDLPELNIHVVDCTEVLSPRDDGLDLLVRSESLARAVEQTVATLATQGSAAIHVRAFEEFLIITATEDAYTQAESLLTELHEHVEMRERLRRSEEANQRRMDRARAEQQIAEINQELEDIQTRLIEINSVEEVSNDIEEMQRLSFEQDLLRERMGQLRIYRVELEADLLTGR